MSTMESRGNPKWLIYVVSAVVFSLAHGTNPNVSVFGLVNIALVGILFAYMFDATKSLVAADRLSYYVELLSRECFRICGEWNDSAWDL